MQRSIFRNVLLFLVGFSLILGISSFDRQIAALFYEEGQFQKGPYFDAMYYGALIPGWMLCGLGVAALFTKKWVREGIFLILVLAIGSGLVAHFVLKEGWPRPRPKQIIEFGGQAEFHPLTSLKRRIGSYRSLPCGHATMGFYFIALVSIGRKWKSKSLIWVGILTAIFYGAFLSYNRMAQGAHFFSDTLVSFFVMGLTAYLLTPILYYERANAKTA